MNWFFETKKEIENETNTQEPNKLVDILNCTQENEADEEYFWYKIDEK